MGRHGTLESVRFHQAFNEPLCKECGWFMEELQAEAMSVKLREMSQEERVRMIRDERRSIPQWKRSRMRDK